MEKKRIIIYDSEEEDINLINVNLVKELTGGDLIKTQDNECSNNTKSFPNSNNIDNNEEDMEKITNEMKELLENCIKIFQSLKTFKSLCDDVIESRDNPKLIVKMRIQDYFATVTAVKFLNGDYQVTVDNGLEKITSTFFDTIFADQFKKICSGKISSVVLINSQND
tara:strand:- start:243 stop:743 length:501 start_codon:yes stop_codon:yes gene_type:complete